MLVYNNSLDKDLPFYFAVYKGFAGKGLTRAEAIKACISMYRSYTAWNK
jgi:hypothetical protein